MDPRQPGLDGWRSCWEPDVRSKAEEFGVSTALDVVDAEAVAEDVGVINPAAVILGLRVVLPGRLRGQQVRAGSEVYSVYGRSKCCFHTRRGINDVCAGNGVGD